MNKRTIDTIKLTVTPTCRTWEDDWRAELYDGREVWFASTIIDGIRYIHTVYINDKCIWEDGVYLSAFEEMLRKPGDYWPFTCSCCGEPSDADIQYPVRCRHRGDQIILVIRDPLQSNCFFCKDNNTDRCSIAGTEEAFDCLKRSPHYHAYIIQKEQLRQQLFELRKKFGSNLDNADLIAKGIKNN